MKKKLAIIAALSLVLTMMPTMSFADNAFGNSYVTTNPAEAEAHVQIQG